MTFVILLRERTTFVLSSRRSWVGSAILMPLTKAVASVEGKGSQDRYSPEDRGPDSDCGAEEPCCEDGEKKGGVGGK